MGLKVIYVTGRSSLEAFVLAVFGGTTQLSVGENGGVITTAPDNHLLLASKENCLEGYKVLNQNIEKVQMKPVFNRLTEVVLARTFDLQEGINVAIGDSETDLPLFNICGSSVTLNHADDFVKAKATHVVSGNAGKGLVDAVNLVMFNYLEICP